MIPVKIGKIKEDPESIFIGPEVSGGVIYTLYDSDLINIVNSIKKNPEDLRKFTEVLHRQLNAIISGLPRPEGTGDEWLIVKKHTPASIWPSITYFGPPVVRAILWHICMESPIIKGYLERDLLSVEFTS